MKLKCSSTFSSIRPISLARLPARISLSLAIRSTTSSVTVFTSTSGGGLDCACAIPAARHSAAALTRLLIAFILGLLYARRVAVVHQASAPLQVGVTLESVLVERGLLEDAARV